MGKLTKEQTELLFQKYIGNNRIIYPAIFHKEDDCYLVSFPDLEGCVTHGNTVKEAYLMAGDALMCWIDSTDRLPLPSEAENIQKGTDDFLMLIEPKLYKAVDLDTSIMDVVFEFMNENNI